MHDKRVEPWLRGTLTDVEPVRRQVLHALELTREDVERWCHPLTEMQLRLRPFGLASVAFHLRHIPHSLDRLLTYAEGRALDEQQRTALARELEGEPGSEDLLQGCVVGLERAAARVRAILPEHFAELRGVGREQLAVPVAGLLIHCAEHTQRHAGQMVTTAKLVRSLSATEKAGQPA